MGGTAALTLIFVPLYFRRVGLYPKAVIMATAGQLILLPLVVLVLIWALHPPDYIVAGMVLLAASPAGGLSNFYAHLGRGNTALSVATVRHGVTGTLREPNGPPGTS